MMNLKTMTLVSTILFTGLVSLAATVGFSNTAFAGTQTYNAKLSGDQEVPPVQSTGTGSAKFQLPLSAISSPQAIIKYTVNATGLENITAAHIHSGKMGANGDVVVTLCKDQSCTIMNDGTLSVSRTFDSANLTGPIKSMDALTMAMTNGETYVNVHTQQHPDGEIRGQITGGTQ